MLNPFKWKSEHLVGLIVASAAGAAAGIAVGFSMRFRGMGTFTNWIQIYSGDALFWALVGAIVVGAAVYCFRVFSS
jgi:hypothetical protein